MHYTGRVCNASQKSSSSWCVLIVTSEVGYATHVRTKPLPIWSSSKKEPSDWSTVPLSTMPAQLEHAPARHEYGRSRPSSSAASSTYVSSAMSMELSPSGVINFTAYVASIATPAPAAMPSSSDVIVESSSASTTSTGYSKYCRGAYGGMKSCCCARAEETTTAARIMFTEVESA